MLRRLPRPRVLKTHEAFDPRYRRAIYIVRDPRDVAVSYYHFNIKQRLLPEGYRLEDFVPRWIAGEWALRYGCWGVNVRSWLGLRDTLEAFLLVRYEDMAENPERELARVAAFLKESGCPIDASPEAVAGAVELCTAERMRAMEKAQSRRFAQTRTSRQDKPFVRAAAAGGWKSTLGEESVERIERAWGPIMLSLGYELSLVRGCEASQLMPVSGRLDD